MNNWFVKHISFPLDQKLKGFDVISSLRDLEYSQYFAIEELRYLQFTKLKILLAHCNKYIPYYKQLFKEIGFKVSDFLDLNDVKRVPVLTKRICKENFDLLKDVQSRSKVQMRFTSGSTGIPKKTLVDYKAASFHKAGLLRGRRWWGIDYGDSHLMVWLHKRRLSQSERFREFITKNVIFLPVEQLRDSEFTSIVNMIRYVKPKYIYGYSSAVTELALLLKHHKQNLVKQISLKGVIVTAEALLPHQKEQISEVFNCPVINEYGCSEVFNIAFQCPKGNFHIAADNILLEIINKNGMPCRTGEIGKIVITDLHNFAMPHIRYELGDMGALLNGACPCGVNLPLMDLVVGRESEMIKLSNGGVMHSVIFRIPNHFPEFNKIKQFRVIQTSYNNFKMLIVGEILDKKTIEDYFVRIVSNDISSSAKIEFIYVDRIGNKFTKKSYFQCDF